MKNWSDRLKYLMKAQGLSGADLAGLSGIDVENIKKYMQGKVDQPRGETFKKLAAALKTSTAYLRDGNSFPSAIVQDEEPRERDLPVFKQIKEINIKGGMGHPGIGESEHSDEVRATWGLPADYIRSELMTGPNKLAIISVQGDSMSPRTGRARSRCLAPPLVSRDTKEKPRRSGASCRQIAAFKNVEIIRRKFAA